MQLLQAPRDSFLCRTALETAAAAQATLLPLKRCITNEITAMISRM
jgi:hypothetical protein